jgi:putative membrane protein
MRMTLFAGATLAAALAFAPAGFAQDKASQKFLKEAIEGNLAEVQMGQLAQKNGTSDGVRSFGQMLEKAAYDRMSKLSGANFDREFAKHMVDDHKKDIKEYEKASKQGDAAGAYAKETLPTLHKHLETAQSLTTARTTERR